MKELPIGIHSISEIINGGFIYIDKTHFVQQLLKKGKYYFIARPRRFGKTLFVSTLEAILRGNKELLKDYAICNSDYDWTKYPVLRFDFTLIKARKPKQLEIGLESALESFAKTYGVLLEGAYLEERFAKLVQILSKKLGKVVILVDEYDKPLLDNLGDLELARANRETLKSFFETLKGLDDHLRFIFITGVGKFAQTSIFSGLNNLIDLTVEKGFAGLFGYTEEEIQKYLSEHIEQVSLQSNKPQQDVMETMREWYNGYKFFQDGPAVFNPHSTLNFLRVGLPKNFWFRTGTPSFLIDQIKKYPISDAILGKTHEKEDALMNIHKLDDMNLKAIMWQTGYLSIQEHDPTDDSYSLDFPNREVRRSFFESLLVEFADRDSMDLITKEKKCRNYLEKGQLDRFINRIKSLYAAIPFNLHQDAREGYYHSLFISFLERFGIKTSSEERTNNGQIDLVANMPKVIYIFEFKLDKSSSVALEQIKKKKYEEKYLHHGKALALVGINFSSKDRNISDYQGEIYSAEGKKISFSEVDVQH